MAQGGPESSGGDEEHLLGPGHDFRSVTDKIGGLVLRPGFDHGWLVAVAFASALVAVFCLSVVYLFETGVGIWGNNVPVAWGWPIINFVWWIGIGHAGTFISAFLVLMRQEWRTSINRFAEAMTLFAVVCAGLFPVLHLGRPMVFYWLFPYPNTQGVWPQVRSPLVWDVFAISTYGTISLLFWYIGMIPDLATLRDRATTRAKKLIYGAMAFGWRGTSEQWKHHQTAYLLLAGLATPLVISVHSIVSLDFSVSQVPGWHSTIFPPYFVAGAIFQGFAMVLIIGLPLRYFLELEDMITERHLGIMAKLMLVTGLIVTYGYLIEIFMAWYAGDIYERYMWLNRMSGPYWWVFWGTIFWNAAAIQTLWFRRVRRSTYALFGLGVVISIGMWLERHMIVVSSLHRDFLPSSWGIFSATGWDLATFVGSMGIFLLLNLLFIRFLPVISISEIREMAGTSGPEEGETGIEGESAGAGARETETVRRVEHDEPGMYGWMAKFDDEEEIVAAARAIEEAGFEHVEAYTPVPVKELTAAFRRRKSRLPVYVLLGALAGGAVAYGMQWYANVIDYPQNIGGRALHSWPAFIPITFELAILGGGLVAFGGALVMGGLPRLDHPVFDTPGFERATLDQFMICIEADDPQFDREETAVFLEDLGPTEIVAVPPYEPGEEA